jgi:ketosteroid isomerase-like protein
MSSALSQQQGPFDSLVVSEHAFAASSLAEGTRAAFLRFLDDSAIVFHPHPVNGKEWWKARPDRPSTLAWRPEFADVAASGDLGYTSGPWTFTMAQGSETPAAFGYFVSVWGRRADGEWKVLLDGGIESERPRSSIRHVVRGALSAQLSHNETSKHHGGLLDLLTAEHAFSDSLRRLGTVGGYRSVASQDIRLYRTGFFPALGMDSALALLQRAGNDLRCEVLFYSSSRSGDLGYTYGKYVMARGGGDSESGYSVRIWRSTQEEGVRLVLDLLLPLPRTKQ